MNRLLVAIGGLLIVLIIALAGVLIALVRESNRPQVVQVTTALPVRQLSLWLMCLKRRFSRLCRPRRERVESNEPTRPASTSTNTYTPRPTQTEAPTRTESPTRTKSPTATDIPPTATHTTIPTETSTPTETPTPTLTPLPTATPTLTPLPTPTLTAGPAWLGYLNFLRGMADLPPLVESEALSAGSRQHAQYVLATNDLSHYQSLGGEFASAAGLDAAQNGNLAVAGYDQASDLWGIGYWISAPFHLVPMLNPRLAEVGHGVARDPNAPFKVTYTIDISSKRAQNDPIQDGVSFPITFPKDGGQMWITKYILPETPDARVACNYSNPTGAPIVVMFGTGELEPIVEDSVIFAGDDEIDHCVLTETTYSAPTSQYGTDQQSLGRQILDKQDAVILIPQTPLEVGKTYTVFLDTDIETVEWSFEVIDLPPIFR